MEKAYFRELRFSNQCELVFLLQIANETGEIIVNQEIRSVRQRSDNIRSLLDHTENKIKKILQTVDNIDVDVKASLTHKGKNISGATTCANVTDGLRKNILFSICKQTFQLIINAPLVQSAVLPAVLYVGYPIQPIRFKVLYADKMLCKYTWCTSSDKLNWTAVGTSYKYIPTVDDVNKFLKFQCVPINIAAEGPVFEIISEMPIEEMSALPKCPFEKRHEYTKNKLSGKNIRVISYNTLSNRYSETNSQYPYCSPQALSIEYRKQLILKELIGYNADIMCLQEVDHLFFFNYFKPNLPKPYKSIFHKKGNRISEGLACFYNSNRFKMLEAKQLVFSAEVKTNPLFKSNWNLIKQSDTLRACFIKQPTSLQTVVLKCKELNEIVIIANTHLYYHAEANDIRLLQANMAMDYIKSVYNKYKKSHKNERSSVIFCGDFNSVPTSSVFKFFTTDILHHSFALDKALSNATFKHSFTLGTACGTPTYTNYTGDFKGCLDYIFYDKKSLTVVDYVPFPDEAVLSEKVALPSEFFPSDHIALVSNLKFT